MDGKMTYHEQVEKSYMLRTQEPLSLTDHNACIEKIKAHAAIEIPDKNRLNEMLLMTAVSMDLDCHFCGDVDEWISSITERLRIYAKQYVMMENTMHGFEGDQPLPPETIFEGVLEF